MRRQPTSGLQDPSSRIATEGGKRRVATGRFAYARDLLRELPHLFKDSWDRIGFIVGVVVALGVWVPPLLRITQWSASWSLVATGLLALVGLLELSYRKWATVQTQLAELQNATGPLPRLDDRLLEIAKESQRVAPVGNRAAGRRLGLRFTDRSGRGILGCQLRVEKVECEPNPAWDPNQHIPKEGSLLWEGGRSSQDIPPGGARTCWIVSATLDLPEDPRGSLGARWTIVPGVWNLSLVVETAEYQVRPEEVSFELRTPEQGDPESLLGWHTRGKGS